MPKLTRTWTWVAPRRSTANHAINHQLATSWVGRLNPLAVGLWTHDSWLFRRHNHLVDGQEPRNRTFTTCVGDLKR